MSWNSAGMMPSWAKDVSTRIQKNTSLPKVWIFLENIAEKEAQS